MRLFNTAYFTIAKTAFIPTKISALNGTQTTIDKRKDENRLKNKVKHL